MTIAVDLGRKATQQTWNNSTGNKLLDIKLTID